MQETANRIRLRRPGAQRLCAPDADAESAEMLEQIGRWREIGVDHSVMDFGNRPSTDPILRFSEQVIAPLC